MEFWLKKNLLIIIYKLKKNSHNNFILVNKIASCNDENLLINNFFQSSRKCHDNATNIITLFVFLYRVLLYIINKLNCNCLRVLNSNFSFKKP